MTDTTPAVQEAAFGFKKCPDCAALFLPNEEDIKRHLADHANTNNRINAIVRRLTEVLHVAHTAKDNANQARRDAASLLSEIRNVRDSTPTTDALAVGELTPAEIAAYTPDADDGDEWGDELEDESVSGETVDDLDPGHVPPAIDRDDTFFGGVRSIP